MKTEFMLAFNEICESRSLSSDVVIEALETALVSAYRRNTNVSNIQGVDVEIDRRTGEATIYAEKEVVDSIIDTRTEVLIQVANTNGFPEANLGDMVMMESTPENFGRIAAQTAKQVILQRVREAEREKLYEDFSAREGEIVNGTVQSVTGQNITIGLGRTEAVLPRSQQSSGERYRAHDKIRVFVLEVRRTSRGPQIIVSRNHRNLLRRLLELEVPEIYNGQVDIKSIAREAGARSKVAVVAMQPGIDPVGACVGMRGVRIQSIVRELNDEKIDVIEWDPDQRSFIAKALSPARVSQVFLEDHPDAGRTAIVIVPDDQLSLAIGREGQNARLAAKLTGWRIDIKSLTEAAADSLTRRDDPAADPAVAKNEALISKIEIVMAKKEANRPITSEDYMMLNRLVGAVEGRIVGLRALEYEKIQKARADARDHIPAEAWDIPIDELDISTRVQGLLIANNITTYGDILMKLDEGDDALLELGGFGPKSLDEVKEAAESYVLVIETVEEEVEETSEEPEVDAAAVADVEAEAVLDSEVGVEISEAVEDEPLESEEIVDEVVEEQVEEAIIEAEVEKEIVPAIDDLGTSLVEVKPETKPEKKKVVVVKTESVDIKEEEEKASSKGKELVFDEQLGRVVAKKKRKSGRRRPQWEEYEGMETDEVFEDEI
ncbi:MAG TPA: transcription termination factor NusA [candidate division Zixibacteria bacterium]|nr:transcription termination factor NusA [candidate division Zixibacteria bacterium]